MKILIIATLLLSSSLFAQNKQKILSRLNANYNSEVTWELTDEETIKRKCIVSEGILTGKEPLNEDGTPSLDDDKTRRIDLKIYTSKKWNKNNPKSQTMILLPPTGGEGFIDRSYARYFCRKLPIKIIMLTNWEGKYIVKENPLNLKAHDLSAIRSFWAIRHTLEFIGQSNVKLFGTSVGAIVGALSIALEDRISGGVLIVGGGGMPEIISKSTEKNLVEIKELRKNDLGFSDQSAYEKILSDNIKIDPKTFVDELSKKTVYYVVATEDETVPTKNQLLLSKAAKKNEFIKYYDNSHITAILKTYFFHKKEIKNFLKNHSPN